MLDDFDKANEDSEKAHKVWRSLRSDDAAESVTTAAYTVFKDATAIALSLRYKRDTMRHGHVPLDWDLIRLVATHYDEEELVERQLVGFRDYPSKYHAMRQKQARGKRNFRDDPAHTRAESPQLLVPVSKPIPLEDDEDERLIEFKGDFEKYEMLRGKLSV